MAIHVYHSSCTLLFTVAVLTYFALFDVIPVTSAFALSHSSHDMSRPSNIRGGQGNGKFDEPSDFDDSNVVLCPSGHFFDDETSSCTRCSRCPKNKIIRRPCSGHQDTWCGPFLEFDRFHQSSSSSASTGQRKPDLDAPSPPRGNHHQNKEHGRANRKDLPEVMETEPDATSVGLDWDEAHFQWRTLAIALIIVLSVVCVMVILVGLYVCIVCRRTHGQKQFLREPDLLERTYSDPTKDEPRYVQTFFTSRQPARSARHLPVYQQIYTGSDAKFPPLDSLPWRVTNDRDDSDKTAPDNDDDQYIYFNCHLVNTSEE